jgi:arylsulfatase A-like enzyme
MSFRYLFLLLLGALSSLAAADKPNILWLTFEDSSPHLGCYGDKTANTPHLDALAARGMRYRMAWSNAPVCAPARTCIITGRWAPSDAAEQMRSEVALPSGHELSPQFLRQLGYYCTNASKEDYNVTKPDGVWDQSDGQAHWKNRKEGQPFFAIFNFTESHESQIRKPNHTLIHDPEQVQVPPYQPDTPEVRKDWATHFDNVSRVDSLIGKKLEELKQAGLEEDTIIFSYSDHGTGMPRSKRWAQSSGLRVPFIVYFPEKWKHLAPKDYAVGAESQTLVQFIDLAPTLLSLAGLEKPSYMQGSAFAGAHAGKANQYLYGFRGRMDERYDMVRSVTDGRHVYVRHFMPHLPEGQRVDYMFQQATTQVWHAAFLKGGLNEVQSAIWREKPSEALYDLESDPHETKNLADSKEHSQIKAKLSAALTNWLVESRDLGFIPEAQRYAEGKGRSPVEVAAAMTEAAQSLRVKNAMSCTDRRVNDTSELLKSDDAATRYWACIGLLMRGKDAVNGALNQLPALLQDASPSVRVAAAELLARQGDAGQQAAAWKVLLASAVPAAGSPLEATEALNAVERLGESARPHTAALAALKLKSVEGTPARYTEYPTRMMHHLSSSLGFPPPPAAKEPKGKAAKGKKKSAKE